MQHACHSHGKKKDLIDEETLQNHFIFENFILFFGKISLIKKKKRLRVWSMDHIVYLPRDLLYNTRGSNHRHLGSTYLLGN
jgi:hypothetical protein